MGQSVLRILSGIVLGIVFLFTGCSSKDEGPKLRDKPNIEIIQDMMDQPIVRTQGGHPDDSKRAGSMMPPDHTVPIGVDPYPYKGNEAAALEGLKNPYSGDFSEEMMALGGRKYFIHCAICHGEKGHGDGNVASKMILRPPTLHSDHLTVEGERGDALLFHLIVDGRGLMRGYGPQIRDERERWAVVNYIRRMQKTEGSH